MATSNPLPWYLRLAVALGAVLLKTLRRTWRIRIEGDEFVRTHDRSPVVLAFWHGQMVAVLGAHPPGAGVLISEHRDGEIISQVIERFGHFSIRGSSSRGGSRALLEAVREVKRGHDVAFTPDGPRGPRHSFAPGALMLAQRTGASIVSIGTHADRLWRLRSWDGFEIPKPFARVTVVYGAPLKLTGVDLRGAVDLVPQFAADLELQVEKAEQISIGFSPQGQV